MSNYPTDLVLTQVELEKGMTQTGLERYRQKVERALTKGTEADTSYGRALLDHYCDALAERIDAVIEEAYKGKPGARYRAVRYLSKLDSGVAAYLALRGVLHGVSRMQPFGKAALTIGKMIEDEVRFRALREEDSRMYERLRARTNHRTSYFHKRALVVHVANKEGIEWVNWPEADKIHIGSKLVNLIIEITGMFELFMDIEGTNRRVNYLRPTNELLEWIEKHKGRVELLKPAYEPMVVPPREWKGIYGGGYLTRYVKPLKLIKTQNKGYLEEAENTDMPIVYAAVNAMQNVAWEVNKDILSVMSQLWEQASSWAPIPPRYDLSIPLCPICGGEVDLRARNHPCFDKDNPKYNLEKHKIWKHQTKQTFFINRQFVSKRLQFIQTLQTAQKFAKYDRIYFPYTLDFRGRVYAVPQFNHQGPDYMKALLKFSKGKPLGERGAIWLMIHGANQAGLDKKSFQERVNWVEDNEEQILAIASNPFDNRGWISGTWLVNGELTELKIDKPWQFLAFCFEWAGYCREGEAFVSHLPIALDGSCSGLQHYSMALRDEIGGAAVNLLPSDSPQDIYQLVADEVLALCQEEANGDDPERASLARQWLTFGINRKVCKRPVMTYPYGSGQYGHKDQIIEDVLKDARQEMGKDWPFEDDGFKAAVFLAGILDRAIPKVVVKAAEGMNWLKTASRLLAAEGLPVTWHTPLGFPVQQAKWDTKPVQIQTMIAGRRIRVNLSQKLDKLDRVAQANGISPNFIHSMDASHLMLTVVRCIEQGVTNLALIHDSFGTLAADTDGLFRIVRESLVELYTEVDVFEEFRQEVLAQLSSERRKELPPPPSKGNLDPNIILDSWYCFA